jgi:cystathionine gamma-lyase
VRLARQCGNAVAIAELLAARSEVLSVRYPGLAADPSHPLARRQMRLFGSVLGFVLPGAEQAERLLDHSELITQATSFGGAHTTAERRGRWGTDDVPGGFIRLSAGIEDTNDLVADLTRALEATT